MNEPDLEQAWSEYVEECASKCSCLYGPCASVLTGGPCETDTDVQQERGDDELEDDELE